MRGRSEEAIEILKRQSAKPGGFRTRDTGLKHDEQPVQHAIDDVGRAVLLVPLSMGEPDVADKASKGWSLSTAKLDVGKGLARFAVLRSTDAALDAQFLLLLDDILSSLEAMNSEPGRATLAVLSRWRALFEPNSNPLLSSSAQIGLLAELHVLESLMKAGASGIEASWAGPDKSRHDFVRGDRAVEVKATTARDTLTVVIHGGMQLDPPVSGNLDLYAEQMELSPTGDSIDRAVGRVLAISSDSNRLLTKLAGIGFSLRDSDAYSTFRFAVLRTKVCRVSADFPRITRETLLDASVMDQITHLQYSIDLGPLAPAAPDKSALTHVTEGLINAAA